MHKLLQGIIYKSAIVSITKVTSKISAQNKLTEKLIKKK